MFLVTFTDCGALGAFAGFTLAAVDAPEVPRALVAVTLKVYQVPLVSPVTVQLSTLDEVQPLPFPSDTVYPVTGLPPSVVGAFHVIVAEPSPRVAVTCCGAGGGPMGVTLAAVDGVLVPTLLVATTVKLDAVPLTRPVTVHESALVVEQVLPRPSLTVYPVMAAPLVDKGAVQVKVAVALPATAWNPPGVEGGPAGVALTAGEGAEDPMALVATTVKL